jgi:hypothetical protein
MARVDLVRDPQRTCLVGAADELGRDGRVEIDDAVTRQDRVHNRCSRRMAGLLQLPDGSVEVLHAAVEPTQPIGRAPGADVLGLDELTGRSSRARATTARCQRTSHSRRTWAPSQRIAGTAVCRTRADEPPFGRRLTIIHPEAKER